MRWQLTSVCGHYQVLDGEAVTAEAREAAVAKVRQLAEEAAQPPLLTSRSGKHLLNVKNNTAMMGRLKAMLANVRKAVKSRRILMQPVSLTPAPLPIPAWGG